MLDAVISDCDGVIANTEITDNLADDAAPGSGDDRGGAGALVSGYMTTGVSFTNVVMAGNATSDRGGALLLRDTAGNAEVVNCSLVDNQASLGGAGIHADVAGNGALTNSIVAHGTGPCLIGAEDPGNQPAQTYTDLWCDAGCSDLYCVGLTDWTGSLGNLSVDPQFVSFVEDVAYAGDDLHLQTGVSACIDAGDPAMAYDDWDGTTNDMGAYGGEFGDW